MKDFESLHFESDWGALVSEDGELASVPDLVRVLVHGGVPTWAAVDEVLDRISHDANVRGYITHPHKYARPIGPQYDWSARFPESRVRPSWAPRSLDDLRGMQWLIEALRAHWKQVSSPVDWQDAQRSPGKRFELRLYTVLFGGQFAIHLDDARRLFVAELVAVAKPSPHIDLDCERSGGAATVPPASAQEPGELASAGCLSNDALPLPERRRAAVARLSQLSNVKGARQKVADEFNVRVRTIGKWIGTVQKEAAEKRKADALVSGLAGLRSADIKTRARA